jgi:hypothetical protein
MTTKWVLALIGGVSGIVLATTLVQTADLQPMVVTNLGGTLRIQQGVPCADDVDHTTPVIGGRFELTPAEGIDIGADKQFVLTLATVSFQPFSIHRSCLGFDRTRNYTEVGVELAQAVPFLAIGAGGGLYNLTIPKENVRLFTAAVVNGDVETGVKQPSEDITGTINLTTGAFSLHVVLATRVHFQAGCTLLGCIINETKNGTLTADITGTIVFPDTDADGVPDRTDNCRFTPNPTQAAVATPVVSPPFNVALASCADRRFGRAIAADVCDAGPVTVTNNAPNPFAVGANIVTWTGEDAQGRVGTATQTVTVVDTTDPIFTFVPPDVSMNNCGPAPLGLPTATDDCAGTVGFTNNAPASFPVGTTIVTWTASDASGNTATASQSVHVVDTVAPDVSCAPAAPPGGTFLVTATDACSPPVIRLGSFIIANGERIKIEEIGKPGITLVGTVGPDRIRHFHVGKGEGLITATDPSNNVGSAVCQ